MLLFKEHLQHSHTLVHGTGLFILSKLVVTALSSSKHIHSGRRHFFFFYHVFLRFFFSGSTTFTASCSTGTAAAATTATASRNGNELGHLFRIRQIIGKDDGVKGFDFCVSCGLKKGLDLIGINLGLDLIEEEEKLVRTTSTGNHSPKASRMQDECMAQICSVSAGSASQKNTGALACDRRECQHRTHSSSSPFAFSTHATVAQQALTPPSYSASMANAVAYSSFCVLESFSMVLTSHRTGKFKSF
jgi:hypothetical protein